MSPVRLRSGAVVARRARCVVPDVGEIVADAKEVALLLRVTEFVVLGAELDPGIVVVLPSGRMGWIASAASGEAGESGEWIAAEPTVVYAVNVRLGWVELEAPEVSWLLDHEDREYVYIRPEVSEAATATLYRALPEDIADVDGDAPGRTTVPLDCVDLTGVSPELAAWDAFMLRFLGEPDAPPDVVDAARSGWPLDAAAGEPLEIRGGDPPAGIADPAAQLIAVIDDDSPALEPAATRCFIAAEPAASAGLDSQEWPHSSAEIERTGIERAVKTNATGVRGSAERHPSESVETESGPPEPRRRPSPRPESTETPGALQDLREPPRSWPGAPPPSAPVARGPGSGEVGVVEPPERAGRGELREPGVITSALARGRALASDASVASPERASRRSSERAEIREPSVIASALAHGRALASDVSVASAERASQRSGAGSRPQLRGTIVETAPQAPRPMLPTHRGPVARLDPGESSQSAVPATRASDRPERIRPTPSRLAIGQLELPQGHESGERDTSLGAFAGSVADVADNDVIDAAPAARRTGTVAREYGVESPKSPNRQAAPNGRTLEREESRGGAAAPEPGSTRARGGAAVPEPGSTRARGVTAAPEPGSTRARDGTAAPEPGSTRARIAAAHSSVHRGDAMASPEAHAGSVARSHAAIDARAPSPSTLTGVGSIREKSATTPTTRDAAAALRDRAPAVPADEESLTGGSIESLRRSAVPRSRGARPGVEVRAAACAIEIGAIEVEVRSGVGAANVMRTARVPVPQPEPTSSPTGSLLTEIPPRRSWRGWL